MYPEGDFNFENKRKQRFHTVASLTALRLRFSRGAININEEQGDDSACSLNMEEKEEVVVVKRWVWFIKTHI